MTLVRSATNPGLSGQPSGYGDSWGSDLGANAHASGDPNQWEQVSDGLWQPKGSTHGAGDPVYNSLAEFEAAQGAKAGSRTGDSNSPHFNTQGALAYMLAHPDAGQEFLPGLVGGHHVNNPDYNPDIAALAVKNGWNPSPGGVSPTGPGATDPGGVTPTVAPAVASPMTSPGAQSVGAQNPLGTSLGQLSQLVVGPWGGQDWLKKKRGGFGGGVGIGGMLP